MTIRNHYKILDVAYDATEQDIKEAYRVLAKKYHPDLNPGDESAAAKFRNVQEAFNCLSDPDLRYGHDALLESKGVDTGKLKRKQEATARAAAEKAEANKQEREQDASARGEGNGKSRPKQNASTDGGAYKKPQTRAERAAEAMAKVRQRKRLTRVVAIVVASVLFLGAMGGLFGGLAAAGVFLPHYNVEFVTNVPGQHIDGQRVRQDRNIERPVDPVGLEGYTFLGWHTVDQGTAGGSLWNFAEASSIALNGMTRRDFNLYAHWRAPDLGPTMATIRLMLNYYDGDDNYIVRQFALGSSGGNITGITREGFRLTGWYARKETAGIAGDRVVQGWDGLNPGALASPLFTWSDQTLWANWIPIGVDITLDTTAELLGSTRIIRVDFGTPAGTVIGDAVLAGLTLPQDLAPEYFTGWYDASGRRIIGLVAQEPGLYLMTLLVDFNFLEHITLQARFALPDDDNGDDE